jgi:hypothetical protein
MPSTDRKLELKAKTSMAQNASQAAVYAEGLTTEHSETAAHLDDNFNTGNKIYIL